MIMLSTLYQTNTRMISWIFTVLASLPKQQSEGRHVAPFVHLILIPSQPVFTLSLYIVHGQWRSNKYQFNVLWTIVKLARKSSPPKLLTRNSDSCARSFISRMLYLIIFLQLWQFRYVFKQSITTMHNQISDKKEGNIGSYTYDSLLFVGNNSSSLHFQPSFTTEDYFKRKLKFQHRSKTKYCLVNQGLQKNLEEFLIIQQRAHKGQSHYSDS